MSLNPFTHGRRKITFIVVAFIGNVWGFALCGKFPQLGPYYATFTAANLGWLAVALGGHIADQKLPDRSAPGAPAGRSP